MGVTDSTITVGVAVGTLGAASAFVSVAKFDPEKAKARYDAFFSIINESGGINGRTVKPIYRTVDIGKGEDDQNAACIYFAQEVKVFAVFSDGSLYGDPELCLTVRHNIPLFIGRPASDEWYSQSNGNLITNGMSMQREFRNHVDLMEAQGLLKGKTIGVVDDDLESDVPLAVDTALIPELKARGYTVAHHSRLSSDFASEIPVEIAAMRRAGVDAIFMAPNVVSFVTWVQQSEKQVYNPDYLLSDIQGLAREFFTDLYPSSLDGTIGITTTRAGEWRKNLPVPAPDAHCMDLYTSAGGPRLSPDHVDYPAVMEVCELVTVFFGPAVQRAGRDLSRTRMTGAIQTLTPALVWAGGGTFGPGKFAPADKIRTVRFGSACRCWVPVDDFVTGRY